ncbi:MAG TPA: hypothetical protein VEP50_18750 [bacterium]|nr:hypothetical protein [bacterium]
MSASGIVRLVAWGTLAIAVVASDLAAPHQPPLPATRAAVRTFPLGWYVLHRERGTWTVWDGPYPTPIACVDALGGYTHEYPNQTFTCRGTRGAPSRAQPSKAGADLWTETLRDVQNRAMATRECCDH